MSDAPGEPFAELLGESAAMTALRTRLGRLRRAWSQAPRPPSVLIQGETGTGKGLLARALHRTSRRPDAPFVDVNCAAVPETLLEAELFGYEPGAFTDARRGKPGLFQVAHGGTLFLDEIGLLPRALQAKLLSVLERRVVRRLGATGDEAVDVWVVAATSEDLEQATRAGAFRADLYHRLAVVTLALPPLRQREDDAWRLARAFVARTCADYGLPPKTLSAEARKALCAYPWPGNVRELGNVIERAALLTAADTLGSADLVLSGPGALGAGSARVAPRAPATPAAPRSPRDRRRDELLEALTETGWNVSRTAARLGLARNTVTARIARFGLRRSGGPPGPPPRVASAVSPPAASPETAPARPGPEAPVTRRWHPRRLALLRAWFATPIDDLRLQPLLDLLADKVRGFGGRVEGVSRTGLLAAFGVEPVDEPAVLAAHGALVLHRAVRAASDGSLALQAGIHAAEIRVDTGSDPPLLDADEYHEAWNAIDTALQRAEPGMTIVTGAAAELLRRRFELGDLGGGLHRVDAVWQAGLGARATDAPLVGRQHELGLLQARLRAAMDGRGHAVDLVGAAGIGKSRLLAELATRARAAGAVYLEGRCTPGTSATPFHPLLAIIRGLCGQGEADSAEAVRARVTAAIGPADTDGKAVAAALVQLLTAEPTEESSGDAEAQRARLFGAIRVLVRRQSARGPLLIALEDLHWIDPTSEACLAALLEGVGGARALVVLTYRPDYQPPWSGRAGLTRLSLPPLSPEDSRALVTGVLARGAEAVVDGILGRAEGNPLFLEELSRAALESGGAPPVVVPATIEDVVAIRIDRLPAEPRRVLATAAVVGRDVPLRVLERVLAPVAGSLVESLRTLQRAEFLSAVTAEGEPACAFRHALIHEVAYGGVPPGERRALHAAIVAAIEALHADRPADHAAALAHHALHGEMWEKAARYRLVTARQAAARSAMTEALDDLATGLDALGRLPGSAARDRLELELLAVRGAALVVTRGYGAPETGQTYARARALCRAVGDRAHLVAVLRGEWVSAVTRGRYGAVRELAEELLVAGEATADPAARMEASMALGIAGLFTGDLGRARERLEQALEVQPARPAAGRGVLFVSARVACLAYLGRLLCLLGFPDRAVRCGAEALALAESRAFSLVVAQATSVLAGIHLVRRDVAATRQWSERAVAYAGPRGIRYWAALAAIVRSWTRTDDTGAAIAEIRRGIDEYRATGALLGISWYLALLAELCGRAGRTAEGLAAVDEALAWVEASGERYWEAELHRLTGELWLLDGGPDRVARAEAAFARALGTARRQGARLWELRAATSLARSQELRGRAADARALLAPIYAAFSEGLDTVDLREAKALLDSLGGV